MKTKLLLALFCVFYVQSYAQVFGPGQFLQDFAPFFFSNADIDSDGDLDLLAPSDSGIYWFENDGTGVIVANHLIAETTAFPETLYGFDIDQDGDQDVLSTSISPFDDDVSWYENMDGTGNFGPQQIISNVVEGIVTATAGDLDSDGDLDVISASGTKLAWYQNTDGLGNFGPQQIISDNTSFPKSVYTVDIDLDDDLDVLAASVSSSDDIIGWYENNGFGILGFQHTISTEVDGLQGIHHGDLDGDGDQDILSASHNNLMVAWYENDGHGNFGPQIPIETELFGPSQVYSFDIDLDDDLDVIAVFEEYIAWYENTDGQGNFGPRQIIAHDVRTAYLNVLDWDVDGDMDLIASILQIWTGDMVWFENLTILSVAEFPLSKILVYPNPSWDKVYISSQNLVYSELLVEIINLNAQVVLTGNYKFGEEIVLSRNGLPSGQYILRVLPDDNPPFVGKIIFK